MKPMVSTYVDTIVCNARPTTFQRTSYPKPFKAQVVKSRQEKPVDLTSCCPAIGCRADMRNVYFAYV
jgi:hypothetical protein